MDPEDRTTLVVRGLWEGWRRHELDPARPAPVMESVASALTASGYSPEDFARLRRLLVEHLDVPSPWFPPGKPAERPVLSYRVSAAQAQFQVDCPERELASPPLRPPRVAAGRRSIRILLLPGSYALCCEYTRRGGSWRLVRHRFVR